MNKSYYVYKHTRLDKNEVFYIGIGLKYPFKKTTISIYPRAYTKNNRNLFWYNIANKTGYTTEIIYEYNSRFEAKSKEIELVKFYGRRDLGTGTLVNLTDGGDGCENLSLEARLKISEKGRLRKSKKREKPMSLEGRKNLSLGHTGLKHTEETKAKIGISNKGKIISEEQKLKLSIFHTGLKASEETKQKMSDAQFKKAVLQYDLQGNFIREFISIAEATKNTGKGAISSVCLGTRKTANGSIWKFK